ncbi:MAG: low-complexity tail membrane protein [Prochlorococcaceae cyanobacterium]
MSPRSEPLLWLQLIAFGAIPLELLGLLLLLAGSDPGSLPGLERLLAWAIGALGPAILLWKRPADFCSLLLVQVPIRARNEAQRTLAALQSPLPLKLAMVGGAAALLPLFWWMDEHAALAASLSPLAASSRLAGLLLACPLLALILWQWQQLTQSLALLGFRPQAMAAVPPLTASQLESQRLNLGLPLLLLSPLQIPEPETVRPEPEPKPGPEEPPMGQKDPGPVDEPLSIEAAVLDISSIGTEASVAETVAIQPEEAAEQPESNELDQEIS